MITSSIKNGILSISIEGEFSITLFLEFQATYYEQEFDQICIDFSKVKKINSSGLGMLLQLHTLFNRSAHKITLQSVPQNILQIFTAIHFENLFKIEALNPNP